MAERHDNAICGRCSWVRQWAGGPTQGDCTWCLIIGKGKKENMWKYLNLLWKVAKKDPIYIFNDVKVAVKSLHNHYIIYTCYKISNIEVQKHSKSGKFL